MKREEEMDRQKRIDNTHKMIEDLNNELRNTENSNNIQPQIDALNAELGRLVEEMARIEGETMGAQNEMENVYREQKGKWA